MASRSNRKASRKMNRKTNRKASRKNYRKQSGGVAPVEYVMGMSAQSIAQGKQFLDMHRNQHGGAHGYEGGPYPGSVEETSILPSSLHASARIGPLDSAIQEIQGMKDQSGGDLTLKQMANEEEFQRMKGKEVNRLRNIENAEFQRQMKMTGEFNQNYKANENYIKKAHQLAANRQRKANANAAKAAANAAPKKKGFFGMFSRRKNRKNRKTSRKQNGGSYKLDSASPYDAPSMLLPSGLESKALGGMNAEWALAKDPSSFAPGL